MKGKEICNTLRSIRKQVAKENNIPFETEECKFEGECKGTCPKCESEVRYIENELIKQGKRLGKVIVAAGLTLALSACGKSKPIQGDVERIPDNNTNTNNSDSSGVCQANANSNTPESNPNSNPRVEVHYSSFSSDMMGDVPYEPFPTQKDVALKLQEVLQYPQDMIDAGLEADITLNFSYNKKVEVTRVKVSGTDYPSFISAVEEGVKHLNKAFDEIEYEEQEYYIPITFTLHDSK